MSQYGFEETKISAQGDGGSLSNSVAQTSLLTSQMKYPIPAGNFYIGKIYKLTAIGRISNIVTTPGTFTFDVKFGSTVVFTSGAMQLSTTAHTTLPFWWEAFLTCRAVGASANLMGQSRMHSQAVNISTSDSTATHSVLLAPNITPVVGSNFDSSISQVIDLFGTFSIANAGNLIQVHQFAVEEMN